MFYPISVCVNNACIIVFYDKVSHMYTSLINDIVTLHYCNKKIPKKIHKLHIDFSSCS